MEVHTHTHTPRKKWTHYFWEFLMLFLAVFCGFLAENIREHAVERHREKQFIESYIEDLKTDTSSMRRVTDFLENRQTKLDSFLLMLKLHQIKGFENTLYYFGRSIIRSISFASNDRTMTQLLNSGSLRLIRNKEAAEKMMRYKKDLDNLDLHQQDEDLERKDHIFFQVKVYIPFVQASRPAGNHPNYLHPFYRASFFLRLLYFLSGAMNRNLITVSWFGRYSGMILI